jgi:hypothetical protein
MRHLKAMIPPTFAMFSLPHDAFLDGETLFLNLGDTILFLTVPEYGVNLLNLIYHLIVLGYPWCGFEVD